MYLSDIGKELLDKRQPDYEKINEFKMYINERVVKGEIPHIEVDLKEL